MTGRIVCRDCLAVMVLEKEEAIAKVMEGTRRPPGQVKERNCVKIHAEKSGDFEL